MRKKTAPQIQKNREASSRKASGLIAQDLSAQQSASLDCVLDNRSHRTRFRLTSLTCNAPVCGAGEWMLHSTRAGRSLGVRRRNARGNNGGNNGAVAGWRWPTRDLRKCLKQQRPALVVAGRRRLRSRRSRVRIAAGAPTAHTSRVTLFFAGYGVGTVGRVRFGRF